MSPTSPLLSPQPHAQSLETLNLGHNPIGNEGVRNLKTGLIGNRSVLRLGLASTKLTCEGGGGYGVGGYGVGGVDPIGIPYIERRQWGPAAGGKEAGPKAWGGCGYGVFSGTLQSAVAGIQGVTPMAPQVWGPGHGHLLGTPQNALVGIQWVPQRHHGHSIRWVWGSGLCLFLETL